MVSLLLCYKIKEEIYLENEFLLQLLAELESDKSKDKIDKDIEYLKGKVKHLMLQAEIDPQALSKLVSQIEKVLGQQITISNIGINQQQVIKSGQQTGIQYAQAINQGVTQGLSSASSATNKILRDFSELNDAKKRFVDGSDLISKEDIADANRFFETVKQAFSEFGQVTITKGEMTDGNLENLRVKIQQVNGELKNTREFMLYLNKSDQFNSYKLVDDDTIKTSEKLIQHLNEEKNIVNVTGDEIERQKQQLADQEKYYKNLKNEINTLYSLQTKLLSADELQTAELEKQIKQTKERISYNNKQLDKKGLTDSSLNREVADLEVKRQKELAIAVAKAQDSISENLTSLKSKWEEQGVLVGDFKAKVEQLESSLSSVGSKSELDGLKGQIQALKTEASTIAQVNNIQFSLETGSYESKVENLISKTRQWVDENGNARISSDNLVQALNNLSAAHDVLSKSNSVENQRALIAVEKELDAQIKTVTSQVRSMNAEFMKSSAVESLRQKVQQFYDINGKSHRTFGADLKRIMSELGSGMEVPIAKGKELEQEFVMIQNVARQTGKLGKTWFQLLSQGIKKFSYLISPSFIFVKAINEIRQAISFAKELDSALTNINYTMDVTASQLEQIGQKSISMAKVLNTSAENVLGAVKLYANAKETADTILKKAQPAVMLSNVTGFTGEQSAKYLQTIMNQFDMTQDDLMNISDIIQSVSQNIAHDFSDGIVQINEGIETSGEVARAAGMDLAQYASMIGLLVEKTGLAGSQIGNSVKTIITRTTKAGKILGIDEGEISDAEKSLKNVGIAVRETDDEFREFKDTMRDLSEVWDDLSDVEKSNIAFNLAGTRQINVIQTLLRNWSDYEDLVVKANESVGVTFENQEKYAESLEGKIKGLSATMISVRENLIGEDEVTPVVNILTKLAEGLDKVTSKLGLLETIGLGSGLFVGIKNTGRGGMLPL